MALGEVVRRPCSSMTMLEAPGIAGRCGDGAAGTGKPTLAGAAEESSDGSLLGCGAISMAVAAVVVVVDPGRSLLSVSAVWAVVSSSWLACDSRAAGTAGVGAPENLRAWRTTGSMMNEVMRLLMRPGVQARNPSGK